MSPCVCAELIDEEQLFMACQAAYLHIPTLMFFGCMYVCVFGARDDPLILVLLLTADTTD